MARLHVRVSNTELTLHHGPGVYISRERLERFITRRFWLLLIELDKRETERWRLPQGQTVQISRGIGEYDWRVDWVRREQLG
ncbi:hypothetical protein ACFFLM_02060 [Deinococcus oregonensis]|uniref:Uncharacterized protein n=1 Tax=Deinococcus oregonensis TaxID=1805970 RepID=A0ABV6ATF7_9DEIO